MRKQIFDIVLSNYTKEWLIFSSNTSTFEIRGPMCYGLDYSRQEAKTTNQSTLILLIQNK